MKSALLAKTALTLVAGMLVIGLGACGGRTNGNGGGSDRPVVKASDNAKTAATKANAFGFRLFGELVKGKEQDNVAASGLSAAVALAFFMEACEGDSRKVLADALGYAGAADGESAKAYADLYAVLNGKSEATVRMANALYVKNDVTVRPAFLEVAAKQFMADAKSRDFADPKTLKELNGWVNKQTDGMIPSILDQLDPQSFAVILNALFFKGQWEQQFKAANTQPREFTPETGAPFQVPMMSDEVKASVWYDATLGAARLPYKSGDYSMVAMLPLGGRKLADLRSELTGDRWAKVWASVNREAYETHVGLPKFKVSATHALNKPLTAMGIGPALEEGTADYSRMAEGMDAKARVSATVTQKVVVEVDEEGTKAAAVTAVEMKVASAPMPEPFRPYFDRPFIFAIVEHQTGAILFLGQVTDPRK